MATTPKETIGTMECMCCGREIPVKQGPNGTINAACNWCDFPAWAKKGTEAARIIGTRMTPVAAAVKEHMAQVQAKAKPPATPSTATHSTATPSTATHSPAPARRGIFHGL